MGGIYLDGVCDTSGETPVFHPLHSLSAEQVQTLLNPIIKRIMMLLTRTGHIVEDQQRLFMAEDPDDPDTAQAPLHSAACTSRIALGPRAGHKGLTLRTVPRSEASNTSPRCASEQEFSLHAEVCCAMNQRHKLEQLCRHITRPAIANERLLNTKNGEVVLQLQSPYKEGTTHIVMSALEFMQRLAAFVPRPRLNLIRFHGVLALNAKLRSSSIPQSSENSNNIPDNPQSTSHHSNTARLSGAQLLNRVLNIDVAHCSHCSRPLKSIAAIQSPSSRILAHLGLPTRAPPKAPARAFDQFAPA